MPPLPKDRLMTAMDLPGTHNPRSNATGEDDTLPPGWSYNPSAWWPARIPILILAVIGLGISSYLALFQWDAISEVWEPFFGNGSRTILHSSVSRLLPFPDAALGALGYLGDAVSGAIGGPDRWRRMPWIVILFGVAVGPLGAVSITLVIVQPVLFHAWCTLCLASALISTLMIAPALDETLASLQYLKRVHQSGGSMWRALWGLRVARAAWRGV